MKRDLSSLQHPTNCSDSGGRIVLLNTGALITPEDLAMIQAMYSRDPRSIFDHLSKLAVSGSGKFMSSFYVGYNHASIGDCGTITLCLENVSMLVAKAVQDWMLYSGQEGSTRYLDFSKQPFYCPVDNESARAVLESWRAFYLGAMPRLEKYLSEVYPKEVGEDEKVYNKAIKARCFDILRGFLPAGSTTNLSWHGDLRQTRDKLLYLRHHPLSEVRSVADAMETLLLATFPNSFSAKRYEATEHYIDTWMKWGYYFDPSRDPNQGRNFLTTGIDELNTYSVRKVGFDFSILRSQYSLELGTRPPKTELPKIIGETGQASFNFLLDFGSFRDIQRHRAVYQQMPLLSLDYGFHPWYLSNLSPELRSEAEVLIRDFVNASSSFSRNNDLKPVDFQYFIPMGFRVPCRVTGDLPSLVYLAELRSTSMVHPTLQEIAKKMGQSLRDIFRHQAINLALHIDEGDTGRFDVRRGTQDIVVKS